MAGFFGTIGRRSSSTDQLIQSIFGQRIQGYYAEQERTKKQKRTSEAISGLYGIDPSDAGRMSTLAGAGMAPSAGFIAGKVDEQRLDKWISGLSDQMKATVQGMSTEQQIAMMNQSLAGEIKKRTFDSNMATMIKLRKEMPKDTFGDLDLDRATDEQRFKYANLLPEVMPEGASLETVKKLAAYFTWGQTADPRLAGKQKTIKGLKPDDITIIKELGRYMDYSWDDLPEMARALAVAIKKDTPAKWDEYRNIGAIADRAFPMTANVVHEQMKALLPAEYKKAGLGAAIDDWNAGILTKGPLFRSLEKHYIRGTNQIKMEILEDQVKQFDMMAKMTQDAYDLAGTPLRIQNDLIHLYFEEGGQWDDRFQTYIEEQGYTDVEGKSLSDWVEEFQRMLQAINTGFYREYISDLRSRSREIKKNAAAGISNP